MNHGATRRAVVRQPSATPSWFDIPDASHAHQAVTALTARRGMLHVEVRTQRQVAQAANRGPGQELAGQESRCIVGESGCPLRCASTASRAAGATCCCNLVCVWEWGRRNHGVCCWATGPPGSPFADCFLPADLPTWVDSRIKAIPALKHAGVGFPSLCCARKRGAEFGSQLNSTLRAIRCGLEGLYGLPSIVRTLYLRLGSDEVLWWQLGVVRRGKQSVAAVQAHVRRSLREEGGVKLVEIDLLTGRATTPLCHAGDQRLTANSGACTHRTTQCVKC